MILFQLCCSENIFCAIFKKVTKEKTDLRKKNSTDFYAVMLSADN